MTQNKQRKRFKQSSCALVSIYFIFQLLKILGWFSNTTVGFLLMSFLNYTSSLSHSFTPPLRHSLSSVSQLSLSDPLLISPSPPHKSDIYSSWFQPAAFTRWTRKDRGELMRCPETNRIVSQVTSASVRLPLTGTLHSTFIHLIPSTRTEGPGFVWC